MPRCFEWTETNKETLARMWNSGQMSLQIAQFFGISGSAVLAQIYRMQESGIHLLEPRKRGPCVDSLPEKWTQEDMDEVFRRSDLGSSPEAIAYYVARTPYSVSQLLRRREAV